MIYPSLSNNAFVYIRPDNSFFSYFDGSARNIIEINNSAKSILTLCDGTHSYDVMIQKLQEEYNEKKTVIIDNIEELLQPLLTNSITLNQQLRKPLATVRGNPDHFLPDAIIWEITDHCPLRCEHCCLPDKNNTSADLKGINSFLQIIDESGTSFIQISGGEPITHPHFNFIVDQLIDRKLSLSIITSGVGVTLNETTLAPFRRLKEVNGLVQIGLDGDRETHNKIRRTPKAYDKTIDFIKTLTAENIKCCVATSLINQDRSIIEELTAYVKSIGVSSQVIGLAARQGNVKENNLTSIYNAESMQDLIHYLTPKYGSANFSISLAAEAHFHNFPKGYNPIRVRPNFDVCPCPVIDIKMGNLLDNTLGDIMTNIGIHSCNSQMPSKQVCGNWQPQLNCENCMAFGLNSNAY